MPCSGLPPWSAKAWFCIWSPVPTFRDITERGNSKCLMYLALVLFFKEKKEQFYEVDL